MDGLVRGSVAAKMAIEPTVSSSTVSNDASSSDDQSFVAISQIFPLYLRYFGRFDRYGAVFALTLLLLPWFYFLAHSILIGASIGIAIIHQHVGGSADVMRYADMALYRAKNEG